METIIFIIKIVFFETFSLWDTLKTVIFLKFFSPFLEYLPLGKFWSLLGITVPTFCLFHSSLLFSLFCIIILLQNKSSVMAAIWSRGPPRILLLLLNDFNALISSLVCLTLLYYCKINLAIWKRPPAVFILLFLNYF